MCIHTADSGGYTAETDTFLSNYTPVKKQQQQPPQFGMNTEC